MFANSVGPAAKQEVPRSTVSEDSKLIGGRPKLPEPRSSSTSFRKYYCIHDYQMMKSKGYF